MTTRTGEEIGLREAHSGDASSLAELSRILGYPVEVGEVAERLFRLLDLQGHQLFVAELADEVVGWVHVFEAHRVESPQFAELGGLVVATESRRLGVGRVLVEAAERWAGSRGIGSLRVRTNVLRGDARAFYASLGFESVKTQSVLKRKVGVDEE